MNARQPFRARLRGEMTGFCFYLAIPDYWIVPAVQLSGRQQLEVNEVAVAVFETGYIARYHHKALRDSIGDICALCAMKAVDASARCELRGAIL